MNPKVGSYRIIDARYDYEFEGGHIRGASNFGGCAEDDFKEEFLPDSLGPKFEDLTNKENESAAPGLEILIFHCEFSSARGPNMLRCLRNM